MKFGSSLVGHCYCWRLLFLFPFVASSHSICSRSANAARARAVRICPSCEWESTIFPPPVFCVDVGSSLPFRISSGDHAGQCVPCVFFEIRRALFFMDSCLAIVPQDLAAAGYIGLFHPSRIFFSTPRRAVFWLVVTPVLAVAPLEPSLFSFSGAGTASK